MTPKQKQLLFTFILLAILFYADPVYAGPGGTVAKAFFKTWWGKTILALLTIIFLPLIIYMKTVEFFAVRKAKQELSKIGLINKDFSWLNLEKNVHNVFTRVHNAWSNEDMKEVSEYVNHWYWQNQQSVYLNQWKAENIKNVCNLESVGKIKPLYIEISEDDNFEGSKVAFSITANIEDYLIDRDTRRPVKGKKGYNDEEKIWIMEYTDGKWLLDDIRDGDMSLQFAKLKNIIPDNITSRVLHRA
ncbi:Tim44 domain-containing protein [Psychroserpens sp. MEBiC05023]